MTFPVSCAARYDLFPGSLLLAQVLPPIQHTPGSYIFLSSARPRISAIIQSAAGILRRRGHTVRVVVVRQ